MFLCGFVQDSCYLSSFIHSFPIYYPNPVPLTCSVVGCRSNYKSEKSPYIPILKLPKDPAKRLQWLDTLGFKDDFIPGKNFRVCEIHFKKGVVQKFGN